MVFVFRLVLTAIFMKIASCSLISQAYHVSLDSLSAHEILAHVKSINHNNNRITLRGKKTHKLDSVFIYDTNNNTEPLQRRAKIKICHSDTLEIIKGHSNDTELGSFFKYRKDKTTGNLVQSSLHTQWSGSELEIDTITTGKFLNYYYNEKNLVDSIETRSIGNGLNLNTHLTTLEYDNFDRLVLSSFYGRDIEHDTLFLGWALKYNYQNNFLESILEFDNHNTEGWIVSDSTH